jgi:hypothetical protein
MSFYRLFTYILKSFRKKSKTYHIPINDQKLIFLILIKDQLVWFSPGTTVSSTNKTDHHNITEILLQMVLKHHNS